MIIRKAKSIAYPLYIVPTIIFNENSIISPISLIGTFNPYNLQHRFQKLQCAKNYIGMKTRLPAADEWERGKLIKYEPFKF